MAASMAEQTSGGNRAFHNFYNDYTHIVDPNLRRRLALSEIDRVPFGLYHVRAVLVAGVGFFLDSYDIFAINLVIHLLGLVYFSGSTAADGIGGNNGILPDGIAQALKASTSAGIVVGMVLGGYLADAIGRRRMYGFELILLMATTFSCAIASSSTTISIAGILIFWRVLMGIGIGGDYPLSAVITSEFAPTRWRGAMIAAVFAVQGFGVLASALVALVTTAAFRASFIHVADESLCDAACRAAADRSWRIIVGVGILPACFALFYRITIPETPRYTFDVQHDVEKAGADIQAYVHSKTRSDDRDNHEPGPRLALAKLDVPRASWADARAYFGQWKNLRVLIGTTTSWFFLDFAFYGLGLNNNIALDVIGYGSGSNLYQKLYNQALCTIILTCAGAIPGYWTAVLAIDTVGRKPLQFFGFLLLAVVFCILGFRLQHLSEGGMLALYIVGQLLFNAGPNTTTFVVPGECFPTRYRATGHGLSAAVGKIGAIIAQAISIPLLQRTDTTGCVGSECSPNLRRLLQLFALFMLFGALTSLLIPETKGMTLEELSGESRTSYNAGCNGSVRRVRRKGKAWNPLAGGQPAGFSYVRASGGGGFFLAGGRRRSRLTDIMAVPGAPAELLPRPPRGGRRLWWWWRRGDSRSRSGSNELRPTAQGSRPPHPERLGLGTVVQGARDSRSQQSQQQQVPTWGAGWGQIDRGRPAPSAAMGNLQFRDEGSLLRMS